MGEYVLMASTETHRLRVYYDENAFDPREEDNMGAMICWHKKYNLGDKHNFASPEEFLTSLFCDRDVMDIVLKNEYGHFDDLFMNIYLLEAETEYIRLENLAQEIIDAYETTLLENDLSVPEALIGRAILTENPCCLEDIVFNEYSIPMQVELIEHLDKYVILPLYLYDHSGITMSTSRFPCIWDSGQVGWIYAKKDKFRKETGYTEEELFSTKAKRMPQYGERVKVLYEGKEVWGQFTGYIDGRLAVDLQWNYSPELRDISLSNLTFPRSEIIEVLHNKAEEMLQDEVKTYDLYLRGLCYGFLLEEVNRCECCGKESTEVIDSCGGFLAENIDELKVMIKSHISKEYHNLVDSLDNF